MEIFLTSSGYYSLLSGLIVGLIAPLLGVFVVARRASMISDTLAHTALVGVGIGFLFGIAPSWMTILVSILAATGIEYLVRKKQFGPESIQAVFLSGGLALSLVLVHLSEKVPMDLEDFLFGNIRDVTLLDTLFLCILGGLVLLSVHFFWWKFVSLSLNEEFAEASGVNISFISWILSVLVGITVALSLRIVGGLLIGSMMIIPVLTAMTFSKSFLQTTYLAIGGGVINIFVGFLISYITGLPTGSTIALCAIMVFVFSLFFGKKRAE